MCFGAGRKSSKTVKQKFRQAKKGGIGGKKGKIGNLHYGLAGLQQP
jgi:hypothetical protein